MSQYGAASSAAKGIWGLDPRNIGGCTLWLDATDASTMFTDAAGTTFAAIGNSVQLWKDKSSSGNNAIQATASNRPTRITDTVANLPSMSFTPLPTSQFFSLNANSLPIGQANGTYFAVFRADYRGLSGPPTNNVVFSYGGVAATSTGLHREIVATSSNTVLFGNGLSTITATGNTLTTTCVTGMFQDYTMSAWANGVNGTPVDIEKDPGFSITGTGTTSAFVGGTSRSVSRNVFSGNIHEILVFNRALANAERHQIEGYLAWKWGFVYRLPPLHPYFSPTVPSREITTMTPANLNVVGYGVPVGVLNTGNLPVPALWYDASNRTSVYSYPVIQWYDKSGQNNHAVAPSNTAYANYTSGQYLSGNGQNTRLAVLNPTDPFVGTSFTYFMVERRGSNKSPVGVTGGLTAGGSYVNFVSGYNTNTSFIFSLFGGDITTTVPAYTNPATEPFRIWSLVFKSTSGGREIWLNGALANSNTLSTTSLSANAGWALLGALTSNYLQPDGDIREIISYKTFLNSADQQTVEGYLAWKWGLQNNLPVGHTFKNAGPVGFNPAAALSGSTCRLWLDAADTTTVSKPLTRWLDKSGNNNHADARLGFGAPGNAIRTDALVNSLRLGVGGNGATTRLTLTDSATPFVNTSFTTFIVERRGSGKNYNYIFGGTGTTTNTNLQATYVVSGGNSFRFGFFGNDLDAGVPAFVNTEPYRIWSLVCKGNSVGDSVATTGREIWLNGTLATSDLNSATLTSNAGTSLFNMSSTGILTEYGDGHTRELLSYTRFLNSGDRQKVEGYLAWKWGLQGNLPVGHAYNSAAPVGFSPLTSTANSCRLWFDGNDTATMSETDFQLRDLSGNTRHASGISTALTYASGAQNGLGAVDFTGSANSSPRFFTNNFVLNANSSITMFMLLKRTTATPMTSTFDMFYTPTRTNFSLSLNSSGVYGTTLGNSDFVSTYTSQQNAITLYRFTFIPGPGGLVTTNGVYWSPWYVNGKHYGVLPSASTGTVSTSQQWNLLNGNMSGTLYETLVYGSALSEQQSRLVEGYLAYKWGIQSNLETSQPFNDTNYLLDRTRPFARNFMPTDIEGCQLWIDPSDATTVTVASSKVTSILNKSGAGGFVTNASSTITYTDTLNGRNVITGTTSGSQNTLSTVSRTRDPVNHSFFYVVKYPTSTTGSSGIYYGSAYFGHTGNSAPALLEDNNAIPGGLNATSSYGTYASANAFYGGNTFVCAGVRQNDNITLTTNGRNFGTTGGNALGNETSGQYLLQLGDAQFAEVIVYNGALNEGQRQTVEGYLMWKWGLRTGATVNAFVSIPTTHPYYNNPPSTTTPDLPGIHEYKSATSELSDLAPVLWIDPQDPSTFGVDANNRIQYIFNKANRVNTNFSQLAVLNANSTINGSTYALTTTALNSVPVFINQPIKIFGTISGNPGLLNNQVYYAAFTFTVNSVATGTTLNITTTSNSMALVAGRPIVFSKTIPGTTPLVTGQVYYARTITGTNPTTTITVSTTAAITADVTGLTVGALTGTVGTHAGHMRFAAAPNSSAITTLDTTVSSGAYCLLYDMVRPVMGSGNSLNGPLLTQSAVGTGRGLNYFDFSSGGSFPITSATNSGGTTLVMTVGARSVSITFGSITSNIATVLFVDPGVLLFAQGQQITIAGTGTSFDATFTVVSCTQTSVTFNLIGSGVFISSGTISVYMPHNIPVGRQVTLTIANGLYSGGASATGLTGTYITQTGTAGNVVSVTIPSAATGALTGLVGRVDYGNILLTNIAMNSGSSTATFTTGANSHGLNTSDSIFLSLPDTIVTNFRTPAIGLNRANGQYTVTVPNSTSFTVPLTELGGAAITATGPIAQTLVSNSSPAFAYFPIGGYCLENRFPSLVIPAVTAGMTIIAVTHLNPGPGTVISSQAARSGRDTATQTPILSTAITLDAQGGNDLSSGPASAVGYGGDVQSRLSNYGGNGIRGSLRRNRVNAADVSPTDTSVVTNTTNGFRIMTHSMYNANLTSADVTPRTFTTAFGGWRNTNATTTSAYNPEYYGYSSGSPFSGAGLRVVAGSCSGTTATLTFLPAAGSDPLTVPFPNAGQTITVAGITNTVYNIAGTPITGTSTSTTVNYTVPSTQAAFTGGIGTVLLNTGAFYTTNHLRIGADTSATGAYNVVNSFLTDSFYDGGIGDILVFNSTLTLEQRQFVEGYLAQKYRFQQFLGGSPNSVQIDQPLTLTTTENSGLVLSVTAATCANVTVGSVTIPYVTLTFTNTRTTNPFVPSAAIIVAGITPAGYSGTFYVTSVSTTSPWTVSYAVSTLLGAATLTSATARPGTASTNTIVHPYRATPAVIDGRLSLGNTHTQNLVLWLDAANRPTLAISDSRISEWTNAGGIQPNFTGVLSQVVPEIRPTYVPNVLNGLPAVRFMPKSPTDTGTITATSSTGNTVRITYPTSLNPPTLYKAMVPASTVGNLTAGSYYFIRSNSAIDAPNRTYDVTVSQSNIFGSILGQTDSGTVSVACSFYDVGNVYSVSPTILPTSDSIATRTMNTEFTYFGVLKVSSEYALSNIFINLRDSNNASISINPSSITIASSLTTVVNTTVFSAGTTLTADIPYIFMIIRRGNVYTIRRIGNGTYGGTTSTSLGDFRFESGAILPSIGAFGGGDTTSAFCGDIYETMLFKSALPDQIIQTIEGYLAWKWGFVASLTPTHPYKKVSP